MRTIFVVLLLLACAPSFSQKAMPLGDLERLEQLEKVLAALKEVRIAADNLSADRYMGCMKAVGEHAFCECLKSGLPVVMTFSGYIAVTTRTREENKYSSLSKDDKKVYDLTTKVRDECVAARKK